MPPGSSNCHGTWRRRPHGEDSSGDDEQGVRNLLDTLLSRKGYDVLLADGGRRGLELFRRECPDVVVLDLNMPELSGGCRVNRFARSRPARHRVNGRRNPWKRIPGAPLGVNLRGERILSTSSGRCAEATSHHPCTFGVGGGESVSHTLEQETDGAFVDALPASC